MLFPPRHELGPVTSVVLLEKESFLPFIEKRLSKIENDKATGLSVGLFQNRKIGYLTAAYAPQVAIKVEQLKKHFGTTHILRIGTCGGLRSDLSVGTILLHNAAIREEGTSKCYVASEYPAVADVELLNRFSAHLPSQIGITWTTDGRYVETSEKILNFSKLGAVSVEMETSALYVVSSLKAVKALSISVVSDRPIDDLAHDDKGVINKSEYDSKVLPTIEHCIEAACQIMSYSGN